MQKIQPKIIEIQKQFDYNKEKMNAKIADLYKAEGVNPWASLVPVLFQLPIYVVLYKSILQLSESDPHFEEGFLWIPSLAGPNPEGEFTLEWLLKIGSAGHEYDILYLIVPILLVSSQILSQKLNEPPIKR